jgi:hypothetical protein
MNNPFSPYFAKFIKDKKVTKDEEKIIQHINALFSKRIPSEIVNFLNGLAFLVEFIHFEQTIQRFNREPEKEEDNQNSF